MVGRFLAHIATAFALPVSVMAQTHAPIVETPPEPGVVPGCGFYAIIGTARSLDGAFDLQDRLGAKGSGVLDTTDVEQFRDGFHSVVFGPFGDRTMAEERIAAWRAQAPDGYVKFGCVDGVWDDPNYDASYGPLPIRSGVYVREHVDCDRPPNGAFRVYSGDGISGSTTRECRLTVEDRQGNLYGGSNSCENTYDGSRTATELSVRLLGPDRFRLAENGAVEGAFRYCANLAPDAFGAE